GLDLGINGRIVNHGLWKWDAGVTLGTYKTKITALPQNAIFNSYADATYISQVGKEANLFYGYQTNGVFSTNAEAAASGLSIEASNGVVKNFTGGDVRFVDVNGDKVIDEKDRVVIGNPNPDFFGSFSNHVSWKRWSLEALMTFSVGNDLYNYTRKHIE